MGKKKNKKSGFHCGMDEASAELSSTEDNPRENNCQKVFSYQVRQPSLLRQSHAVISVIHEKSL